VSIVIPSRDEGPWLRRTVEAVLATSGGHEVEVIVVDDGSSDGSADFLRRGIEGPARVVQGGELGVARARNRGAVEARGDYIIFVDANVVPDEGWLDEMVGLLEDPSVGLAGVGVRDYENAASVGYSCMFIDERLQEGWSPPPSHEEPFDVPCIIGCCVGIRRTLFEEIGPFDPGHVRWGVEDVEMSVRAWRMGYRCAVSPRAQVAHYFKHNKPRNFEVSWGHYDVNLLRFVLTYFTGPRLAAVVSSAAARPNFPMSAILAAGDAAYWERRRDLQRRFVRDEAWYLERFAGQLSGFEDRVAALTCGWRPVADAPPLEGISALREEARLLAAAVATLEGEPLQAALAGLRRRGAFPGALAELAQSGLLPTAASAQRARAPALSRELSEFVEWAARAKEVDAMVTQRRQRCLKCGAMNIGIQEACMICRAPLPEGGAGLSTWQERAATATAAVPGSACSNCGAALASGAKFCVACGTPAAAAPAAIPVAGGAPQPRACRNCGAALANGARFCVSCGTPAA
jgi:GT2 family glycosyltransferase